MKWDYKVKEQIQYTFSGVLFIFGMVLVGISAFAIEPLGEVHSSIIGVFGFCLSFVGAVFGLNLHYSNELNNFKQEVRREVDSSKNHLND